MRTVAAVGRPQRITSGWLDQLRRRKGELGLKDRMRRDGMELGLWAHVFGAMLRGDAFAANAEEGGQVGA